MQACHRKKKKCALKIWFLKFRQRFTSAPVATSQSLIESHEPNASILPSLENATALMAVAHHELWWFSVATSDIVCGFQILMRCEMIKPSAPAERQQLATGRKSHAGNLTVTMR